MDKTWIIILTQPLLRQAHNKIKTNMAGLQCFGCGQGFGFFRREVSFTFLLWMKTLRRFTFHDIFCDFLYERWPVSGLQKLNFFVSSLLKSTSDTTKSLRLLYSFVTYCYIRSNFIVHCVKIHAFFSQTRFPTFVDNLIDIKIFVAKRANLSLFFLSLLSVVTSAWM